MGEEINSEHEELRSTLRSVNRACTRWLVARGLWVDAEDWEAAAFQRQRALRILRNSAEAKIDKIVDELSADD